MRESVAKEESIRVRVTTEEKRELLALAAQAHLSLSEWVRLCALTGLVVRRRVKKSQPTREAEELLREVLGTS
jgi:uncharacterized protein HemY